MSVMGINQRNRINILSQKNTFRKRTDRINIPDSVLQNNNKNKKLSEIMRNYDVENISPKEMAKMSQELFDNGHISFKVHSFLSFQPELNPSFNSTVSKLANTTGNPDQARNFLKEWEDQLRELQKEGASSIIISNTKEVVNILGNLHTLQI